MDTTNVPPITEPTKQVATPLNTIPENTVSQPKIQPSTSQTEQHGHGKKVFTSVLVVGLVIALFSFLSLYLFNKNQAPQATKQVVLEQPSITPTAIPSPTAEDESSALDTIDTGNPDSDLQELQKDVNQL